MFCCGLRITNSQNTVNFLLFIQVVRRLKHMHNNKERVLFFFQFALRLVCIVKHSGVIGASLPAINSKQQITRLDFPEHQLMSWENNLFIKLSNDAEKGMTLSKDPRQKRLVHTIHSHLASFSTYEHLASFPGLPTIQFLITCSVQKRRRKGWYILFEGCLCVPRYTEGGGVIPQRA